MNHNNQAVHLFAAAALSGAMLTGSALAAQNESGFTALEGIAAQKLTSEEQQSVSGELNAYTVAMQLKAAGLTQLANIFLANAVAIDALYKRLGIYTPIHFSGRI